MSGRLGETARFIALVVCAVLCAVGMFGCAPTSAYVAARNVETGAAQFVDTGADAWHQYSHAQLENYKAACADLACFTTTAGQWESNVVAKADKVISAATLAVREYDASLNTADALKQKDFSAAVAKVVAALTDMYTTLISIGVKIQPFVLGGK